jgi:protein TonB
MPADLFGAVVARRRSTPRRFGAVPLSVALHVVLLVAIVVIPLVATPKELPTPQVPADLQFKPTPVVVVPPSPPPVRGAQPRLLMPERPAIPLTAPTGIPGESVARPTEEILQLRTDDVIGGIPGGEALKELEMAPPPPPPAKVSGPVRVGQVAMPRKIHDVAPVYPQLAVVAHVEGTVTIEAIISTDGTVQEAHVTHSIPLLDAAALEAVRQWVFTPTRLNGEPVPVMLTVNVEFKLR